MEDVREILFNGEKILSVVDLSERCRLYLKENGYKFLCKPYDNGIWITFIEDVVNVKEYAFTGNESESMIEACQFVYEQTLVTVC